MKAKDLHSAATRLLKGYEVANEYVFSQEPMMRTLCSAFLHSSLAYPDKVSQALYSNSDIFILAAEYDNGLSFLNTDYDVAGNSFEGVAMYYDRSEAEAATVGKGSNVMVMSLAQVAEF